MFDRNDLEMTPVQDSLNAYKFTAVSPQSREYAAYAQATRNRGIYSMVTIAKFKDPRDAAYVGQQFAKKYTIDEVYQMALDKTFKAVADEFVKSLEIPVWQYPAEGLDWDDIFGFDGTVKNRVQNGREALVEALKHAGKKAPALPAAKALIEQIEAAYKAGASYRSAAKEIVSKL